VSGQLGAGQFGAANSAQKIRRGQFGARQLGAAIRRDNSSRTIRRKIQNINSLIKIRSHSAMFLVNPASISAIFFINPASSLAIFFHQFRFHFSNIF